MKPKDYAKLFRLKHYIKNVLIFMPFAVDYSLLGKKNLITALCGFCAFCFISSCAYILNDLCDFENDRNHPVKQNRPIASGKISVGGSIALLSVFAALAAAAGLLSDYVSGTRGVFVIIGFLVLNIIYSSFAKFVPVLEMMFIPAGFIMRLVYGYIILGRRPDILSAVFIFLSAFYFVLHKRSAEKSLCGSATRKVLGHYSLKALNILSLITMIASVALFGLLQFYFDLFPTNIVQKIISVAVLCALFVRFEMLSAGTKTENTVEIVLSDRLMCIFSIAFAASLIDYPSLVHFISAGGV